jgi:hypothetical protein
VSGTPAGAFLSWLPMVPIAILNGLLRESTYGKRVSELHAHQISCLTGVALFAVYIWLLVGRWPPASERQALLVGALWILLTVAFEFLFGRLVAGHTWSELLADYNILAGRLWSLVLLWLGIAPWLFSRLRAR